MLAHLVEWRNEAHGRPFCPLEGDFAMTRLFLAAGVAALAITVPASAKPGGGHGGGNQQAQTQNRGGGGHGGANVQARGGGGGGKAFRVQSRGGGGGGQAFRMQSRGGGQAQARSFERRGGGFATQRTQRQSIALQQRGHGRVSGEAHNQRGNRVMVQRQNERGSVKAQRFEQRQANRQQLRGNRMERVNNREAFRNEVRGNRVERMNGRQAFRNEVRDNRQAFRDIRGNRVEQVRNREAFRDELRANRIERLDNGMFVRDRRLGARELRAEDFRNAAVGYGVGGCPPGLASKGCMPPGQAAKLLGTRFSDASRFMSFSDVPLSVRYLYPDTNDYYYRYGDGYMYRVDRSDALISALLPLAFGGYYPGSYLPSNYLSSPYYGMNSFYPSYYGFDSFYPASYGGFGYGYDNLCNRYANGVVYQVDCATGFVEDAIPMYAGGYGVGQFLPSGYGYYNVPYQYRDMYYDTSDYGYWYAPGAIYQYDPGNRMITSVAALLSPGFSIGQPLPMGYDVYNVPYAYRQTYYDTPNAWYRYNNGYIYQVDPMTQLVTAIVASILR
jgi:hypothetical protein